MKRRIGLVQTCVISALLSGAGWVSTGALAQTATTANRAAASTDALAQADPVPYWWFHGTVEAGGRFFLNNPLRNGSAYLGQNSLAKYYTYSTIKPGPFSDISLATGSNDGLYQIAAGGKNIGYSDQRYYLDMSKAGQHYLNLGWDQTPHVYSTSAQTPYRGVGTNALTLPSNCTSTTLNSSVVVPCLQQTDIGIRRDTASVDYRWTPNDSWDIRVDLTHRRRTGTQTDGIAGLVRAGGSQFSSTTQVTRPVADTTQNYGVNGEYVGTSAWGQRYTFKMGYSGSQYSNDLSSYTIQSPFCDPTTGVCGSPTLSPFARMSLPPSNQANSFNETLAADLPWKSRYVGTVSYTMMRQDAAFIPMTNNPAAPAALNVLPASSLNGAINTLLSNNVVTTQITPELRSKLTYRYYDFQNNTPEILFPSWTRLDNNAVTETAIRSLSMSYTKQNAGEELTWHPSRQWTLGTAYGYERYDWTRQSVDATNEHSGKVFADWKPTNWVTLRSSGYFAKRRYENYDYNNFVGNIQFPGTVVGNSFKIQPAYRQLMVDNRDRWKANFAVDIVVAPRLTITPTFKYQDDDYGLNPQNESGLRDSRSWNGGVDATYVVNPDTSFMAGYVREYYTRLLYGISSTSPTGVLGTGGVFSAQTDDRVTVDTFTALVRYAAIPDRLDTELRYTASRAIDHMNLNLGNGAIPAFGQYPDVTTWFQRLDATATYKLDPALVAQLGWIGEVKAKLHYAWERNSVSNWTNDPLAPFSPFVNDQSIWLAGNNPNYSVHLLAASIAWKW